MTHVSATKAQKLTLEQGNPNQGRGSEGRQSPWRAYHQIGDLGQKDCSGAQSERKMLVSRSWAVAAGT